MRAMMSYDLMETMRVTNQWLGASAQAMGSYPVNGLVPNPFFQMLSAWGDVTERSFSRMVVKPDWGIESIVAEDGRDHIVTPEVDLEQDFGDLVRFRVQGRPEKKRKILLAAPMSGHYATLLRSTVVSLLPDAEVWITDWKNARDIPVSAGKFDVEDYSKYLVSFMQHLGSDTNLVAVCQPVPLALVATGWLAQNDPDNQPASLTLIGGPVDPDAAATDVTDFGHRVTMGQLERMVIQRVGFKYAGAGRPVYPGLLQLASFISMNTETHQKAFTEQIMRAAKGEASDHDRHNKFYDEYLAVMDMTAEFYLSTVERIFKEGEIARNAFTIDGEPVDLTQITDVPTMIVEGENDDISGPGQCLAALDIMTGLPKDMTRAHLEPGAGHYGIFAGKSWRNNIRPLVLDFVDQAAKSGSAGKPANDEKAPSKAAVKEKAAAAAKSTGTGGTTPV